jgi:hypothetical protein
VFVGACEKQTQFFAAPWNQDMPERLDEAAFAPVQSNPMLEIREKSPCCCPYGRYLCHNFRQVHRCNKVALGEGSPLCNSGPLICITWESMSGPRDGTALTP